MGRFSFADNVTRDPRRKKGRPLPHSHPFLLEPEGYPHEFPLRELIKISPATISGTIGIILKFR